MMITRVANVLRSVIHSSDLSPLDILEQRYCKPNFWTSSLRGMLFAGLVTEDSEYFSREEGLQLYPQYQFYFRIYSYPPLHNHLQLNTLIVATFRSPRTSHQVDFAPLQVHQPLIA